MRNRMSHLRDKRNKKMQCLSTHNMKYTTFHEETQNVNALPLAPSDALR